ncbi:MAG: hypothetical protein ACFCVD_13170 [Nodosilinea sp.]
MSSAFINKTTGTAMQILGGLIVLHSINSNLGIFRNQTLSSIVVSWFRDFPLGKRPRVISLSARMLSQSSSSNPTMHIGQSPTTLEERIVELGHQVEKVRLEARAQDALVSQRFNKVEEEFSVSITSNQSALNQLSAKIEEVTVGGFKLQAFGVLLAIYGAVVSVFA